MDNTQSPASYKDPSGFIFYKNKGIYRQINTVYKNNYDLLISSGLYKNLVESEYLVPHKEIPLTSNNPQIYKIIKPTVIPFISYPYEWCFSQLKEAALLTLKIQKKAIHYGMSLKDATSFNIQFINGNAIFIDTLSFEIYKKDSPWIAYKQFCEQFLAPLVVASYKDIRLLKLIQHFEGNFPLDLAAEILPLKAKLIPSNFMHILLHSYSQKKYQAVKINQKTTILSRQSLKNILDNLENAVSNLKWKPTETVWTSYKEIQPSYSQNSYNFKLNTVESFIKKIKTKYVWDIGANTGEYSRIASKQNALTISIDNDPSVVEINYLNIKKDREKNIIPLWIDIVNPTPSSGFTNAERTSFLNRPHPDAIIALALIHHLSIGKNLPISILSKFFSNLCKYLIIEFVPKDDPQVKILLRNREDIFTRYSQRVFETEFRKYFILMQKAIIPDSKRLIYLFKLKDKYENKL